MEDVQEHRDKTTKFVARSIIEVQRAKLAKLMEKPDKPVIIPESKERKHSLTSAIPTFVRNVMGSSAGAGSGEFHVYRHLRRKEYARQKQMQNQSKHERLEQEFHEKIDQDRQNNEAKTAKKRAKRLRRKDNWNRNKLLKKAVLKEDDEASSTSSNNEKNDSESEEIEWNVQVKPISDKNQSCATLNNPNCEQEHLEKEESLGEDNQTNNHLRNALPETSENIAEIKH